MELCKDCVYNPYPKIPQPIHVETDLAIVGEAPGISEIAHKKSFVGPSGQLLDKALQAVGLPPQKEIYITNALLCKPPPKKPQIRAAIKTCQRRLIEELEKVQPRMIIALGNIAMHALTNDFDLKITREQGRVLKSPFLPDTKILPAIHPAAVLRSPGDYKLFYSAMHYASNVYSNNKVKDPGITKWKVARTESEIAETLKILKDYKFVAADLETSGLDWQRDFPLVLGVAYDKNKVFVYPDVELVERMGLFKMKNLQCVWQNGKFDTHFVEAPVDHDVMLISYLLNEQGGVHDLGQLSSRELGAAPYKHKVREKLGKKGFAGLPEPVLFERVATDADYTLQLFHKMHPRMRKSKPLSRLYDKIIIPASSFLRRVERNGMWINQELLEEFRLEYQEHLDEIQDAILEIAMQYWDPDEYQADTGMGSAPEVFNPGSTYQVAWLLYDVLQLKPRGRRKKRSTDAEMLDKMQGMHPIIDLMLEYRSVSKELSTYIIGVKRHIGIDDRVHTTYKIHGTVTGRLSSSQPNVQNQPKRKPKVRNQFQAPEGKKLLEVDYKGAELRVLAHVSQDEFLTQCFVEGRDLHSEVAKALGTSRIRAKAVNFGIPYGRTEYTLAEEFGVSNEEAREYIVSWFRRAPSAKRFMDYCEDVLMSGKTLITPFGRHRRFGLVTPEALKELINEARNFIIQSVSSDLTLLSAMRMEEALTKIDVKIINLVHDSILFECPDDKEIIVQAMAIARDVMTEVPREELQSQVPFEVEFAVGTEWGKLEEVTN